MLRKIIALTACAAALTVVPAAAAVAEPYSPQIPTRTSLEVTSEGPGEHAILVVSVSANYETPPEGDLEITLSSRSASSPGARAVAAAPVFRTTVHFENDPIRLVGPRLPKGTYLGVADFTPDDGNLFLPSSDTDALRLGARGPGAPDGGPNLPNTGGPNMMWLFLGTGLVAAGAGGVGYGRRRREATA